MSLGASLAFAMYETSNLNQRWKYLDRLYPEPTQLQKTLNTEAMQQKEHTAHVASIEERMLKLNDPNIRTQYSQFYQLAPQRHKDEWRDPNAPAHKEHW